MTCRAARSESGKQSIDHINTAFFLLPRQIKPLRSPPPTCSGPSRPELPRPDDEFHCVAPGQTPGQQKNLASHFGVL